MILVTAQKQVTSPTISNCLRYSELLIRKNNENDILLAFCGLSERKKQGADLQGLTTQKLITQLDYLNLKEFVPVDFPCDEIIIVRKKVALRIKRTYQWCLNGVEATH